MCIRDSLITDIKMPFMDGLTLCKLVKKELPDCQFNLKSLKYSNTATYYLVIADEQGLQLPQREPFQIDIAFAVDEFDFFS